MKKIKALAFIALFAALHNTACQKEVTKPIAPAITKEALAGTYKVTALVLKPTTGADQDVFATLEDCQKQSRQVLNPNFSYQLNDACDPADNQTGTWALHNPQSITINGLTGTLVSFDGQKLVLSFNNFMGLPGTMVETLTKQ